MTWRLYQARTEPVPQDPETVTESRWHQPLSDPTRRRGINTALIPFGAISPWALTQPEQTYYSKYAYPWSEPIRLKRGLAPHLQQFFAYEPDPINLIIINDIPWYNWLSIPPVLAKRGLRADCQPVSTISPYIPSIYNRSKGYVIE